MKYPVSVLSCVKPGKILHLLDLIHSESVYDAHERTQRRLELHRAKEKAEDGKVAVVWGGRDCDGVRYSGHVVLVDADWRSLERHIEETCKWADGPCGYYLLSPSEAEQVESESRDLTLEAFEDGHSHVLYG